MKGVLVGAGVMGHHHLRVLQSLGENDVSVAAVVDPDSRRREAAVRRVNGCNGYSSLEHALAGEKRLDFACIAAPPERLAELATAALQAGLHVLVEKPMAANTREAQELLAIAEAQPTVFMVGLVERCNPAVRALKEKLVEQRAGHIMQLQARRLSPFPTDRVKPSVALDLATHDVDVMRYVSGAEVERVYAETASMGTDREDLVCATLRLEDGITGLLETNWITPVKVRQLSVTCERGMFVVDYLSQDLTFYEHPTKATVWEPLRGLRGGGEGDMTRYAIERWEPLRVEWDEFLAAIRTGTPVSAGPLDGCAVVEVADALRISGQENRMVEIVSAVAPVAVA